MDRPPEAYTCACRRCRARHAISWVEMDCRQKEWSKEVSKEQYLSYVALEVVLLPYTYVLIGPLSLEAYLVSTRVRTYDRLLPAATAEVSATHGG